MVEYAYSTNEEIYYEDLEDACHDLEVGVHQIWRGKTVRPKVLDFINIDWLIESIQENAYEECTEFAEDYLHDISSEQKKDLEETISAWFEKNNLKPTFFKVEDIEEIEVKVGDASEINIIEKD